MRTLFAIAMLAGISLGHDPLELLASPDRRQQAWGAYHAGEQGLEAAVPALRKLVAKKGVRARIALDALIRLRAGVGWQDLEPLYEDCPEEVLILLALHPAANRERLMAIARSTSRRHRLHRQVACNLLADAKDPGLAAVLLEGMTIELVVDVSDDGGLAGGAGGSLAVSGGRRHVKLGGQGDDWPPIAVYRLTERQGDDAVALTAGPRPVFYARKASQGSYVVDVGYRFPGFWKNGYRFVYLAHLLRERTPTLRARHHAFVQWAGEDDYVKRVHESLAKVEAEHTALLDRLIAKKLLDADARTGLRPDVRIVVDDRRTTKTPLPAIQQEGRDVPKRAGAEGE